MQTHNTGVMSLNPISITIKAPLVREATGNHLIQSPFLDKLRALSLFSVTLKIEYATQVIKQDAFLL